MKTTHILGILLCILLTYSCSDDESETPVRGELPTENQFTPTSSPSGIKLVLNKLIYEEGEKISIELVFEGIERPDKIGDIVLSSSKSGDVEKLSLTKDPDSEHSYKSGLIELSTSSTEPADGKFSPAQGEVFYALYFPDKKNTNLPNAEDLIFDFAFFGVEEGGPKSEVNVEVAAKGEDDTSQGSKASGTLVTKDGIVQIATEEVILYAKTKEELNRFLALTEGKVLSTDLGEGENSKPVYLVEVDASKMDTKKLAMIRSFYEESHALFASKQSALDIYQLVMFYRLEGFAVTVNPKIQYADSPSISAVEEGTITRTMKMASFFQGDETYQTRAGGCVPNDPLNPCVFNVPALWAFNVLWDKTEARIPVAVLDMGFATNQDFRPPSSGSMVECDMNAFENPTCGVGSAQGPPTVGNSLFGKKSWHGTGVVTVIGGVVNDGFGAAGVAGQVAVPMIYKYDGGSYVFQIGQGIRKAVQDGASCVNISGGYPCRIITNVGPFDVCTSLGRAGICSVITAGAFAAAATICAATAWIPFVGAIACGVAVGSATTASVACFTTIAVGDLKGPMERAIEYATQNGVPVVSIAGNDFLEDEDKLPGIVREIISDAESSIDEWRVIPGYIPNVITVGSVNVSNLKNKDFYGNRVDIWAPVSSAYVAPTLISNPSSPLERKMIGATSAAAPYIAGVIANMQAINPSLNPNTPGLTAAQKREIVGRIRAILLEPTNNFTNSDLVTFGFPDDPRRRLLVNPLKVIQAAAGSDIPDVLSMGYNTFYNFDEALHPNDRKVDAIPIPFETEISGTILSISPFENMTPVDDEDWYSVVLSATADRLYKAEIEIEFPTDPNGDEVNIANSLDVPRRGEQTFVIGVGGDPIAFAVVGSTPRADNVYKIKVSDPEPIDPIVTIIEPAGALPSCDETLTFEADIKYSVLDDPAGIHTIPSAEIVWTNTTSNTEIGTGMGVQYRPGIGMHTIEVRVFGSLVDTLNINVIDCVGQAPVATISSPNADVTTPEDMYAYTGHDNAKNLDYTDVLLVGSGNDFEDGVLSGSSLVWKTDLGLLQPQVLGTGNSITARLYSNIRGGLTHTIRLEATDSNGNTTVTYRRIFIWTLL